MRSSRPLLWSVDDTTFALYIPAVTENKNLRELVPLDPDVVYFAMDKMKINQFFLSKRKFSKLWTRREKEDARGIFFVRGYP
jgi:hypothetical protein